MTRIRFYIGTGSERDGSSISEQTRELRKAISERWIAEEFGGCTVYDATGIGKDDNGVVREAVLVFETMGEDSARVTSHAAALASLWNQTSVMYTVEPGIICTFTNRDNG
jgi:hypothetical protein